MRFVSTPRRNAGAEPVGLFVRSQCFIWLLSQKERNHARLRPRYDIIARIKAEAGCADCGLKNPEHPEIYDFDHLPEFEKTRAVSLMLTKGTIEEMLAEIAKCEVVCANCHRIRTYAARSPRAFGRDRGPESHRQRSRVALVKTIEALRVQAASPDGDDG
jgi:hypothetical protein